MSYQNYPLHKVDDSVRLALQEDIGSGDVSAELLPEQKQNTAMLICRENAILAGQPWFNEVFRQLDSSIKVEWHFQDSDSLTPDSVVCEITGDSRLILTGERTAMNFLQTLSATATVTHEYVQTIAQTQCKILDTRKTIPGLREAQKYAVVCGGGENHRRGLYDAVLLKENHIAAAGSITQLVKSAKQRYRHIKIQIEVESLDELNEALDAGTEFILLDNFSNDELKQAVSINNGKATLEASGGYDLNSIKATALTGVDYISIGALTKHVKAVDFSLRVSA